MNRIIPSILGLLLTSAPAWSQDHYDVARYSMLAPQGTARSIGFGGSLGSVGADFSSLSVNPAGIGLYRRGELSFTPSIRFGAVTGNYLGSTTEDAYGNFNISNLGLVTTTGGRRFDEASGGWKSVSFGFGLNRVADFNRSYSYVGRNSNSSFTEAFALSANQDVADYGKLQENSFGNLGYQTYLIDQDSLGYYSTIRPVSGFSDVLGQRRTVSEKGGINELLFSLGGNYEERIMLGATIGVPILRYRRDASFTENDASNTYTNFQDFTYTETLKTTGVGVNMKFGVIVKPSSAFRFGAAIHTPTWYSLTDEQTNSVISNVTPEGRISFNLPQNEFSYQLRTPWRGVLSGTTFLGNWGFVSADYEFVDYKSSRFTFETKENQFAAGVGAFSEAQRIANDSVRANLQAASNFRLGGEAHIGGLFFRAGLGLYGSPYKNGNIMSGRTDLSAGFGFRGENGFIDFGFVHTEYNSQENPYILNYGGSVGTIAPVARLENNLNNLAITVGTKF